jgi:lipopolysaccharide export system permease protein
VFWGILHRSILMDLFKIFALTLCALTGLILLAGIISEAMKNGLGPMQIAVAIPLMLPSLLPYTVPTTTLFATCIVYGRLSADNEFLALRAAGVHVAHVLWPGVFLGLLASAVTMGISLDAIPYTSYCLKSRVADDIEETLYSILRKDGCLRHFKLNYEIDVDSVQGRKLHDVVFKRRAPGGKGFDVIVRAREAELNVDLERGRILVHLYCGQISQQGTVGVLEHQVMPVEIPDFLAHSGPKQRASDMTWSELFEYETKWQEDKEKLSQQIDAHQSLIERGRGAPHYRKHVEDLTNEHKTRESQILAIRTERHQRVTLAMGCFCFALVGCPIGIWFSKSDYLSSFITCFLPIVTIYYPLLFCTLNLSRAGKLEPWAGVYAANVLMLLVGTVLFRRLSRH